MNVLVVEPSQWGHRLSTAGLLLDAVALVPGCNAFFATSPAAVRSIEYSAWIAGRVASQGIVVDSGLPDIPGDVTWRTFNAQIAGIRAAVVRHNIKHVLIPSGDGLVQIAFMTRLFSSLRPEKDVEYEAMLLRGRFAYESNPTFRQTLTRLAWFAAMKNRTFDRIHHMDPVIHREAIRRSPALARRFQVIPDPVDPIEADLSKADARSRFGMPVEGRVAGCVGVLDTRKGIDLLLKTYAACVARGTLSRERDRLMLVGKPDRVVTDLLEGAMKPLVESGSIVAVPKFVSDVEMSNAITAMDLIVTPYPGHIGSASIVIRAAAQRRPVLANDFGWLGTLVPGLGLGTVCDVMDPAQFADALPRAFNAAAGFEQGDLARRFVAYSAVANFQAHWVQRLAQRMNVAPPPIVSWHDVLPDEIPAQTGH